MRTPARSPEDIIGIIPHTLGYTPRNSLVALIVGSEADGTQSCATTLRTDFTRETAAQIIAEGGDGYVDLVSRVCTVTGVFLILYDEDYQPIDAPGPEGIDPLASEPIGSLTGAAAEDADAEATARSDAESAGDSSAEAVGVDAEVGDDDAEVGDDSDDEYAEVHRGLVRAAIDELAESFAAGGIDTLSAWWVSRDRFGRIDDGGYDSTPLIAATTSVCATELVAGGSNPAEDPEELVIAPMTAEAFAHSRKGRTDEWMDMDEAFSILADVYPRLEAMRGDDEPFDEGRLHGLMDLPTVMALDALLAEKWSRDALEMILSFDHPDFPPALLTGFDGRRLCELSRRVGSRPDAARKLVGLSPRSPQPRDVMLSIAFLKTYLPLGHPDVRATAYAVIAWFEWALGGSTMAEIYALAALELDPEHGLARLIAHAVASGFLPRWLADTERTRF
ncbi:DUF4192 family protein [Brevibacterium renqingii]|uniref:DUF4192 family protein n=1 Tax=Brevibacterium renqingii TaxID=2776916 RepID=UPI001ADF2605|nr:DUF4192 family protein [Brevibacterium renqingii]